MKRPMMYFFLALVLCGVGACGKGEQEIAPEETINQKCVNDSFPIPFYSIGVILRGTKFPEKIMIPKIKIKSEEKIANYIIRTGKDWNEILDSPMTNNLPIKNMNDLLASPALCGRVKVPNDDDKVLNEWISKTCEGYVYHVEIGGGSSGKPSEVVYFSQITEAIPEDIKVRFDVVYSQPCREKLENIDFRLLENCELSVKIANMYDFYQVCYIINKEEDYKRWVTSRNGALPPIDFSKHTLVAGKFTTANQDRIASQKIEKNCDSYHYTVFVHPSILTATGVINHFAIIPKISNETNVRFNIKYN
jgi:hypothetical protein